MEAFQPFLRVVSQRHGYDCVPACLAMLCGVSYEDALLVCGPIHHCGMNTRAIKKAAKKLIGRTLTLKRDVDLESDIGFLAVKSPKWKAHHMVVLKEGIIIDTDACIYEAEVFLWMYEAKILSILV